jgi:hypothetical protein
MSYLSRRRVSRNVYQCVAVIGTMLLCLLVPTE